MADLFDALVSRALGSAAALTPVFAPRFATTAGATTAGDATGAPAPRVGSDRAPGPGSGSSQLPRDPTELQEGVATSPPARHPAAASAAARPHQVEQWLGQPDGPEPRVGRPRAGRRGDAEAHADPCTEPTWTERAESSFGRLESAAGSTYDPSVPAPAGLPAPAPHPGSVPVTEPPAWPPPHTPYSAPPPEPTEQADPPEPRGLLEQQSERWGPEEQWGPGEQWGRVGPTGGTGSPDAGRRRTFGTAESPAAGPRVSISIGYVEVRAPTRRTAPVSPPAIRRPVPRLSLQDYLRKQARR